MTTEPAPLPTHSLSLAPLAVAMLLLVTATVALVPFAAVSAEAGPADGQAVFQRACKSCHEPAVARAPGRADLARKPRADIITALTRGVMAPMAARLSADEITAVASYLVASGEAAADPGGGKAEMLKGRPSVPLPLLAAEKTCAAHPAIRSGLSDWASQGIDSAATRYQRHPELTRSSVQRLKLKWSFSMSGGGQPTVVGDWLFVTNRSGRFYALDARSGCVHWSVDGAVSRTTPMVVKSSLAPSGWASFIGLSSRVVRAYDAQTGQMLWESEPVEAHPVAVLTGSPVLSGDQLFVPISSLEEPAAINPAYPCCTFSGAVAALDVRTGRILWKTKVLPETNHPTRLNAAGAQMHGPAGGAIWSAPMVDARRGLVYVGTGDSYTDEPTAGADAIIAMDMKTGAIRWSRQVTAADNFVMGCSPARPGSNCPTPVGPDYDFGATPILFSLPSGKQVLLAGQKSGAVYGLDPDTGRQLWKTQVGSGSALGGVEWGMGADTRRLYVPISDIILLFQALKAPSAASDSLAPDPREAKPGLYALDPATGRILWSTPAPKAPCAYAGGSRPGKSAVPCMRAQSAAPAVIPGVVFSGTMDGWLRAYDARTGQILWSDSTTARTYDTVNGVKGQPGGSIDGLGLTVSHGMVYVMSGFDGASRVGGNGVNVLLAYSVDGR